MKRLIPLILALLILAAGGMYLLSTEREDSIHMRELYNRVEPLQQQKTELLARKQALADEYKTLSRDISTVEFLVRGTDELIFTTVYPAMRERGIIGSIGISMEDFPGIASRSKMNVEQYNRLMMDGWGSCLIYDSRITLKNWLTSMRDILKATDVNMPTSIYFTGDKVKYDPETMDPILQDFGIDTVVVDASDGRSTVTEVGDIWITGARPWNYTGVKADMDLLGVTYGGNLLLTVSVKGIWDGLESEFKTDAKTGEILGFRDKVNGVEVSTFLQLLDQLEDMQEDEDPLTGVAIATPTPTPTPGPGEKELIIVYLNVTTISEARRSHLIAQTENIMQMKEYEDRQEELDNQISVLDAQISAIYNEFNSIKK